MESPPKRPPDRFPAAIGPYAIRERIGRGGMGVVYRARDEKTKTEIALKVMASDLDGDAETRERFFREANVAGRLRHRNIVTVLDSGEDAGRLYIAMELLTGKTLAETLKDASALDIEDRIDVMLQVCQGLSVAHAAGVYHRDLKPANLFMCDDRRMKILDFGVARLVGSNMTVAGNIIGTPDFMSPEQVRGQEVDGRADIFSIGSVFYLLLTGRRPFAAKELPAVLSKVVRSQPLPIREDEAPESIAAVIRKAMAKDPAARQQNVGELAWELMEASASLEAATRQTALNVRPMAEELIRLATRRSDLSAALDLPAPERDPWAALREQYPILQTGPQVLGTFPVRSALVKDLEQVLLTELESLRPVVRELDEAHAKNLVAQAPQSRGVLDQSVPHVTAGDLLVAERLASQSLPVHAEEKRSTESSRQLRLRTAAPSLRTAERAFAEGDFERARWSAENALALAPDSQEAHALLAQITAAMPEPGADDTVKLDDPLADTVKVAPWQFSVQERITDVCAQASVWIGRWWSHRANAKDR